MSKYSNDRRNGPDFWLLLTRYLSLLGWLLIIVAMVIAFYAAPETDYGLLRYYQLQIRTSWVTPLTTYLYFILWFNALLSIGCIVINRYRSRRSSDSHYFNLVLLLLVSTVWFLYIFSDIHY